MKFRLYNLLALVMLAMFFIPFIMKVRDWDLIFILACGLALPAVDFFTSKD